MERTRRKKQLRFIPYAVRLLAAMMAVTVFVAAVIGVALRELSLHMIREMESTLTEKNMQIVGDNLNLVLSSVDDFSAEIASSSYLNGMFEEPPREKDDGVAAHALEAYLSQKVKSAGNEYSVPTNFINLYLANGYSCIENDSLPFSDYGSCVEYYMQAEVIKGDRYIPMTWAGSTEIRDKSGKMVNSCVWLRFLYDSVSMEKEGVLVGGVDENAFKEVFGVFPHAYLCQGTGLIISSTDKLVFDECIPSDLYELLNEEHSNFRVVNWTEQEMEQRIFSWRNLYYSVMLLVPEKGIQRDMSSLRSWYATGSILVILVGVLVGTLINYFLTKKLSRSILSLKSVVQQVDEGELSARYVPVQNDEIAYLGEQFNHMLDSLDVIYKNQEREALDRKNLEIQLLQSQINPHLLYNTLNSVALAVQNNDEKMAEDLVFTLSDFIRISLSKGRPFVPLSSELELLEKYIHIQKLAGHREIRLNIEIPEEMKNALIIRTSLQPIVENSVIHGLAGYRDDGEITIFGKLMENRKTMLLCIRDNGLGMDQKQLEELNHAIQTTVHTGNPSHYGLHNVNARIRYTWGPEYGIIIDSELSDYTEIRMTLPYIAE